MVEHRWLDNSARRLFIAVATGQGVSNLAPILETARTGDCVLWLVSAAAKQGGWTEGPSRVLKRYDIRVAGSVDMADEPAGVASFLTEFLEARDEFLPVVVGNGGTKISLVAITSALARKEHAIVYGQDRPAELWIFPQGISGPLKRIPYSRAKLTLADVLDCTGHKLNNSQEALQFWPSNTDLGKDGYGVDPAQTAEVHEWFRKKNVIEKARKDASIDEEPWVSYDVALALAPGGLERWCRTLMQFSPALARLSERMKRERGTLANHHSAVVSGVFNGVRRVQKEAKNAATHQELGEAQGRIGPRFELAVARRVQKWLQNNYGRLPVTEAWMNVQVPRSDTPGKLLQELDVLLVLTNGLLLAIECKSFDVNQKDLDARLLNLQRSGSILSRQFVCAPLYTEFCGEPWFEEIYDRTGRLIVEGGLPFMAFTIPDQPTTFCIERDGLPLERTCHPFESALHDALRPYIPMEQGADAISSIGSASHP